MRTYWSLFTDHSSHYEHAGGRRDSNPQQPEPQSGALPLSYGHHHCQGTRLKFEFLFANKGLDFPRVLQYFSPPVEQKSACSGFIMALRHRAKRAGAALFTLFFFLSAAVVVGQQDDPSEIFLKAYLSAQQGEKLERENRFNTALAKYRFAGSLIETLRRSHPAWQPAIVEYRGRKISEGILRIQERTNRLSASSSPLPEVAPSLPESDGWSEPGPEVVAPQSGETTAETLRDSAIKEPAKKLHDKVDQLQAALGKARSELETARIEKETVNTRLTETNAKLEKVQNDLEKAKKSEQQTRDQVAKTEESLGASQASQESSNKEQQQLRAEVSH